MPKLILAYWDIRGLAQPIRLMLKYAGEDFEDKKYSCGPAPDFDRSCWLNEKLELGLDFPNLPYLIDGDIKITQSNAVLRYVGRKHNLLGSTEQERANCDMMVENAMDFRNGFVRLCYNPKYEELKADYLKNLPEKLKTFEKFLGDKKWFAGDNITIADFHMYELLDQHRIHDPECLKDFPKLRALLDRFEALPAIKAYMASDSFMKSPINNKMAGFQG